MILAGAYGLDYNKGETISQLFGKDWGASCLSQVERAAVISLDTCLSKLPAVFWAACLLQAACLHLLICTALLPS